MLDGWCVILYTIHQENGIKDYFLSRDREVRSSHQTHNLENGGSNPSPATK